MLDAFKLYYAGDLHELIRLIKKGDIDINSTDKYKRTLLINAVIDNQMDLLNNLIKYGANLNHSDKNGMTALHFAAQNSNIDISIKLIQSGAVIDQQDKIGNTPLFKVVMSSRGEGALIKLLIDSGANPDIKNNSDISPRILANTIANYNIHQFFD